MCAYCRCPQTSKSSFVLRITYDVPCRLLQNSETPLADEQSEFSESLLDSNHCMCSDVELLLASRPSMPECLPCRSDSCQPSVASAQKLNVLYGLMTEDSLLTYNGCFFKWNKAENQPSYRFVSVHSSILYLATSKRIEFTNFMCQRRLDYWT